ncbi:GNAT family N-acetyltransferase [Sphingomonas psychrotolerans]|uniref:GNAT family N-acetyltransferase n=1 Tax=Sphingomonas psychrotolerans TaxID=1327635 RepID=A0A2K8MLE9_9SPHN|nr:GNAT family N-acetyltransferase [Sphingomonas psychrotolerans]
MRSVAATLVTHSGYRFTVRPVRAEDKAALGAFFALVSPEDLRFRFLSAVREVGHERLVAMTVVDHDRTENFLAFDEAEGTVIATAMLAIDPAGERGEVAISIRPDYKHRGVSWSLLEHVVRYAEGRGLKTIESIESREHHAAISLEHEMGFTAEEIDGDPTCVVLRRTLG